jgi:hypothetical protein
MPNPIGVGGGHRFDWRGGGDARWDDAARGCVSVDAQRQINIGYGEGRHEVRAEEDGINDEARGQKRCGGYAFPITHGGVLLFSQKK